MFIDQQEEVHHYIDTIHEDFDLDFIETWTPDVKHALHGAIMYNIYIMCVCMCLCMYVYIHTCIHAYMHTRIHTCVRTYMYYICTYVHMNICKYTYHVYYIYIYICIYRERDVCTCIYTCIYIHIQAIHFIHQVPKVEIPHHVNHLLYPDRKLRVHSYGKAFAIWRF